MFRLETLIAIIVDAIRTTLVEAFSERLASICGRFRRGPRGMAGVRHHIHRQCRKKLRSRLST